MPALIPSAITGVTSLVGGLIGSSAASKAAKQLNATGQQVATSIDKSTGQAIDAGYAGMGQANTAIDTGTTAANQGIADAGTKQTGIYNTETGALQPYQAAGQQGLDQLKAAAPFSFNPTDLANDPGYQFQLAQGNKALQSSAAGRGMLQSGSMLKSMDNYSQGLAGTSYQNAYNRALSTFGANQTQGQTLANLGTTANSQMLSAGGTYGGQLTSNAGLGANVNMTGAGDKSTVAMQGNQYVGTTGLQGAEAAGNVRMQGAGAQAAGTVAAGNSWNAALGGAGGALMYGLNNMGTPKGAPVNYGAGVANDAWMGG